MTSAFRKTSPKLKVIRGSARARRLAGVWIRSRERLRVQPQGRREDGHGAGLSPDGGGCPGGACAATST